MKKLLLITFLFVAYASFAQQEEEKGDHSNISPLLDKNSDLDFYFTLETQFTKINNEKETQTISKK